MWDIRFRFRILVCISPNCNVWRFFGSHTHFPLILISLSLSLTLAPVLSPLQLNLKELQSSYPSTGKLFFPRCVYINMSTTFQVQTYSTEPSISCVLWTINRLEKLFVIGLSFLFSKCVSVREREHRLKRRKKNHNTFGAVRITEEEKFFFNM